jgi:hypothetical protein
MPGTLACAIGAYGRRGGDRFRPFAGMTRIRFEGFGRQAISAPVHGAPLGMAVSIAASPGKGKVCGSLMPHGSHG